MSEQGIFGPKPEAESRFLAHCKRLRFPKRSVIVRAGEMSDQLMYMVRGQAAVSIDNDEGKSITIAYLGRGEFIGELAVFMPGLPRSAWVYAHTDCELAVISLSRFHELANAHVEWLYAVGRQVTSRLVRTTRKTAEFAFHDTLGRIERNLVELCRQSEQTVEGDVCIRFTRQELAMMAGCSREVAGKALKALEVAELIRVQGKTIVVSERLLNTHPGI